jgi:hypothetical protein
MKTPQIKETADFATSRPVKMIIALLWAVPALALACSKSPSTQYWAAVRPLRVFLRCGAAACRCVCERRDVFSLKRRVPSDVEPVEHHPRLQHYDAERLRHVHGKD